MRKKLLAVLMTGAMVASFAGSATAVFAKSDDDNKLTVWAWDQNFNIKSMKIAADQYAKDHEGFSVDIVETSSDDCQTKLTTAANAGDYSTLPDIVLMQDNSYQKYLKSYPDAFTDLKDININWDDFGKLKQSYSMVDDTHYGVPFDNGAVIACYRTDILDEAGYTIDDLTDITWSKFMEIGKDVHEKTGKYLLTSEATGGDTLMMMMQSCGANFVNEDGEAYIVGNEVAEKCINLYVDLVKNDVVKLVNNWDEYIATITGGEAAGIVNGNWITATLMSTEDQKGLWQITTMPKVDDVDTATNYANNGGSSWYVTSNCQNVELAEDFLASTFGSSTEFYDTILPEAGAISCYLPAGESKVYNEPNYEWTSKEYLQELQSSARKQRPTLYQGEQKFMLNTSLKKRVWGGNDYYFWCFGMDDNYNINSENAEEYFTVTTGEIPVTDNCTFTVEKVNVTAQDCEIKITPSNLETRYFIGMYPGGSAEKYGKSVCVERLLQRLDMYNSGSGLGDGTPPNWQTNKWVQKGEMTTKMGGRSGVAYRAGEHLRNLIFGFDKYGHRTTDVSVTEFTTPEYVAPTDFKLEFEFSEIEMRSFTCKVTPSHDDVWYHVGIINAEVLRFV